MPIMWTSTPDNASSPIYRAAMWADIADIVWQFAGRKNSADETRRGLAVLLAARRRAGVAESDLREARRIAELMIADIYADHEQLCGGYPSSEMTS